MQKNHFYKVFEHSCVKKKKTAYTGKNTNILYNLKKS